MKKILIILSIQLACIYSMATEVSGSCEGLGSEISIVNAAIIAGGSTSTIEMDCKTVRASVAEFNALSEVKLRFKNRDVCGDQFVKLVKIERNKGITVPFKIVKNLLKTMGVRIVWIHDEDDGQQVVVLPKCLF